MALLLRTALPVWVGTALVLGWGLFHAGDDFLSVVVRTIAVAVIVSCAAQLFSTPVQGFITRVSVHIVGILGLSMVATAIALLSGTVLL